MIEATILKDKILSNLLHFVLWMLLTKNKVIFPVGVNGVIIVIVVFVVVIIILILIFCPYLEKQGQGNQCQTPGGNLKN